MASPKVVGSNMAGNPSGLASFVTFYVHEKNNAKCFEKLSKLGQN
jgi:hypothetical protein